MSGWDCRRCSYHHHAPAARCVMCNELRVNKEQMRDFILGKKPDLNGTNDASRRQDTGLSQSIEARRSVPSSTQMTQQRLSDAFQPSKTSNATSVSASTMVHTTHQQGAATVQQSQPAKPTALSTRNPYARSAPRLTQPTTESGRFAAAQRPLSGQGMMPPANNFAQNSHAAYASTKSNVLDLSNRPQLAHAQQAFAVNPQRVSAPIFHQSATSKVTDQQKMPAPAQPRRNLKRPRQLSLPALPYQPGPVPLAMEHASTWIYPSDEAYSKREYQFDMAKSAILQNTLVSLPTGLGKTLIAAVVVYNFYRWFPTGKVLFLAPTLPLVEQQVEACYEIMGIPLDDTTLLTGKIKGSQRAALWKEKRVFFCTPQTVQKDLEKKRCDATHIVCVVLDEAHRASGDYAYCKVIQYLQQSGAKFRILGLSATPGTSIKAIQLVVTTLRINCIKSRSDTDPDVKQYVHDRHTEVILVKAPAATKPIERVLDNIIGPILDELRNRNALASNLTGNATMTTYGIMNAMNRFKERPEHQRDNSALGYFTAGQAMTQIRSALRSEGIGHARELLHKLRNGRPRGHLSTVVKSDAFQSLWQMVQEASCDPNAAVSIQDKSKNNPKLEKLVEILREHFERSKACGTSSRAIVFSQFRESVREIVNVLDDLKPLVRARQFVGQGKGSSKTSEKDGGEGMNQKKQKAVLGEFKEGLHNTLVCTSIGEEGLDIGEVDLIVNFDCLRSPIRMIQRVGRTGRKRNGRVVTLVAEGAQQKALKDSQGSEQTLFRALKDPRKFIVVPNNPLLPVEPIAVERNMAISACFRLSQVHDARRGGRTETAAPCRSWKLTETEAWKLSTELGSVQKIRIGKPVEETFSMQIRRRVLAGRDRSLLRTDDAKQSQFYVGRTVELLRKFETSTKAAGAVPFKTGRKATESPLDVLFPLSDHTSTRRPWDETSVFVIPKTDEACPVVVQRSLVQEGLPMEIDDFRLPSQDYASSSDDDGCNSPGHATASTTPTVLTGNVCLSETEADTSPKLCLLEVEPDTNNKAEAKWSTAESAYDDSFRLPTPESSSDEEDNVDFLGLSSSASNAFVTEQRDPVGASEATADDGSCSGIQRQSPARVRFSFDNVGKSDPMTHEGSSFAVRRPKRILAINDTPDSKSESPFDVANIKTSDDVISSAALSNTQDDQSHREYDFCDALVCGVCQSDRYSKDDPVILCDGPGLGKICGLAVHLSCYNLENIDLNTTNEWRCDPCEYAFHCGQPKSLHCGVCHRSDGVLRRLSTSEWKHSSCQPKPSATSAEALPRRQPLESIPQNHAASTDIAAMKMKRRKQVMQRYFLEEAEASSNDEKSDGQEERDVLAMEEEEDELAAGFINDSSQLDYTQDELDQAERNVQDDNAHRALDAQKERIHQFATPLLNRRMQEPTATASSSWTDASHVSRANSIRGLGNMHFIRSVLEHHRNGGTAEQIEAFYHGVANDSQSPESA